MHTAPARQTVPTHVECVEIAELGGSLHGYRKARAVGCTHAECVEIVGLGGTLLVGYQWARSEGAPHATIVEAVTVHGLPVGMLRQFAVRMDATTGADVATVVFGMVADAPTARNHG